MAFDLSFDFRDTSGFVTDPAFGVYATWSHNFPNTYTNSNGFSINAGWTVGISGGAQNLSSANDPLIAGDVFNANSNPTDFKIDLSSGSAPGAGTYTLDLSFGDTASTRTHDFQIKDNTTVVIDGDNGGAGFTTNAGHYIDATLTDVTASSSWTGATASKSFSTTTMNIGLAKTNVGGFSLINHYRLTLQTAGATAFPPRMLMLLGVGV